MALKRSFSGVRLLVASLLAFALANFTTLAAAPKAQEAGNAGTISGVVTDPSGGVVAGAIVEIQNPVSQYDRTATTDAKGEFRFTNIPFNPYHFTVVATGFAAYVQDVDVRSSVPINLQLALKLASSSNTVTVQAEAGDLIENDSSFHTDVDRGLINKLPLESQSSSLSSLVTLSTPGIAADSNGLFHGLGDHAENSFSLDGQPITDQQSKVFSNQIPLDAVQSIQVISGAPPAEYGDKTSVVIDVTTRSGLGVTTPHGSATASYGSFGSSTAGFDLEYGGQKWGNFVSANFLNSGRFLDPPEFTVLNDKGNQENVFDRVDYQISSNDSLHFNLGYTRSWFQTPNSFDSQNATPWSGVVVDNAGLDPNGNIVGPTDQRSKIGTFNIAPSWTRVVNQDTVLTLGAFVRHDGYNYYPSDNPFADLGPTSLQRETVGQNRTLTNAGARGSVSYVKGINNIKAGVDYMQTFLNEDDSLGIVDPTLNAPCLDALGNPVWVGNKTVNNPAACATAPTSNPAVNPAPFTANPDFIPILGCYDLTRTATLPASDGCPAGLATSTNFVFNGHTDVKELAMYIQDTITWKNWNFNLGIRGDLYNGLTRAQQAEPRLGVAYNIKQTNTVLRVSYARTLETPFNENLVLSSIGCSSPVLNPLLLCSSPALTPLSPGFRNEFHAGLEQAFGKHVVFDGEYIWKYTHNGYDFSVLGNTPITFPIEWHNSKIPGFAGRLNVTNVHGFNAYTVFSSVAARFFTPQIGGAGAVPSAIGPFRIDHDEHFNQTTHLQYQPWKRGPWFGFNWRYDSGLVAGPVPCAGGNCANGPLGTSGFGGNDIIDASIISPDQQFQAGLYCGSVHATPTTPISSSLGPNLCLASNYGSSLVKIPAPDKEDDDHNPPRIAPRNLFDIAIGDDNIFHGDRFKWSAQVTVINIANEYALYNFLSTFSGTHYVTPRAITGEIGFHF
ncbi:MAG TPA: TonB-dependent receptor [Candidatus Acidoferrum sp.]|nr:TonB-dependent receptor [Candidatus Acidoferrum sp.]